jgi:uncharacterized protein
MKLAVNYSHAALQLRRQNRLPADLFKCPDWPDHWPEFAQAGPVYIHFRFMAGVQRMNQVDWDQVAALREQSHSPFVNLHIAPYRHWMVDLGFSPAGEPAAADFFALARSDIEQTIRRFGADNVIIENAPYTDQHGTMSRAGVDPELLCRLVADTGCGFLLDLAHARITAHQLNIPEEKYIGSLPLYRLREMHVTGLAEVDGILLDHHPMTEEDWPSAEWAVQCIRAGEWAEPWVMTFEYGGIGPGYAERTDADLLEGQTKRLHALCQKI